MKTILKKILKVPGLIWIGKCVRFGRRLIWVLIDSIGQILIAPMLQRRSRPVRKILLIRLDRIGDMVLTTPAFRAIRTKYPQAEIDVLAGAYTKPILTKNPYINKVVVNGVDFLDNDYDIAVVFHPGWRQNRLTYACGAFKRIGYRGAGGSFFLTDAVTDDRAIRVRHEVESALELAQIAGGIIDDKHLDVFAGEEGELFAENFFKQNNLFNRRTIIIHPGSRQGYIRWDIAGFAALADKIQKSMNCSVILAGAAAERDLVEAAARLMITSPIVMIGAELTGLISVLKRVDVFIGNSTGPMHLAAGVGTAVVAIFGAKHPLDSFLEWGPWSSTAIVVQKDSQCRYCHPSECRRFLCMKMITVDDVYKAVKTQMEKIYAGN